MERKEYVDLIREYYKRVCDMQNTNSLKKSEEECANFLKDLECFTSNMGEIKTKMQSFLEKLRADLGVKYITVNTTGLFCLSNVSWYDFTFETRRHLIAIAKFDFSAKHYIASKLEFDISVYDGFLGQQLEILKNTDFQNGRSVIKFIDNFSEKQQAIGGINNENQRR